MNPSEKINYIKDISTELSGEEWPLIDLTLNQFDFPTQNTWNGEKSDYVIQMIQDANAEKLLELAKHFGLASQLENIEEPEFWKNEEVRVFISHLTTSKVGATKLSKALDSYGMTGFVAHEDIEPTKEWQTEIESALATMDCLIALLKPGFTESKWCDQEIGVAIGRRIPIISVKFGLDPYGFIGKYQALQGKGIPAEEIAEKLFNILINAPGIGQKITNTLVLKLVDSNSFHESKELIGHIKQSKFLTSKNIAAMKKAVKSNSQVSGSWGVPDEIKQLERKIES